MLNKINQINLIQVIKIQLFGSSNQKCLYNQKLAKTMESVIQTFEQFKEKCLGLPGESYNPIIQSFNTEGITQEDKISLIRQFVSVTTLLYDKLLQTNEKLCLMFFNTIDKQLKDAAVEILSQQKFANLLWQYDSLFIGNKKQLFVYKKNYQLQIYLSKYKLSNNYDATKRDLDKNIEELIALKIRKNLKFSFDEDIAQISKDYKAQLKKYQSKKKKLMSIIFEMIDHFIQQQNRIRLTMKAISYLYKDEIKIFVESKGLRFDQVLVIKTEYQLDITKPGRIIQRYDSIRERQIQQQQIRAKKQELQKQKQNKIKQQQPIKNIEQQLLPQKYKTEQQTRQLKNQSKQKVNNKQQSNINKKQQLTSKIKAEQPSKVSSFDLIKAQYGQVKISFNLPSSNNSPIIRFNVYKVSSALQLLFQIQTTQNKTQYQIDLQGSGYLQFTIKAENQIGQSLRYQIFKIFIPNQPNNKLFMRGESKWNMIPNTQEQINDPVNVEMPCSQVVVSNCVMIHDSTGNLAAWGRVYSDQNKNDAILEPYEPFQFDIKHISRISCAQQFYLCCDVLGNAYGFGKNGNSQLGIPKIKGKETIDPVLIPYFKTKQIFVIDIACKGQHSIALDSKGCVYSWGVNQVGPTVGYPICDSFGSVKNYTNAGADDIIQRQPRRIDPKSFGNRKVTKIAIGDTFTSVINEDKQLYTWGSNLYGQLGIGDLTINHITYTNILCPALVPTFNKTIQIIDIRIGNNHSLALCKNNATDQTFVYSWGNSINSACGHQQDDEYNEPKKIDFFDGHKIEMIRSGDNVSFVKTDKGLFQFGIQQKGFQQRMQRIQYQWAQNVIDISSNSCVDAFLVDINK